MTIPHQELHTKIIFWTCLTRPQGNERAKGEPGLNLGPAHLFESSAEGNGESTRRAGLDFDFGHFERTEGDIGDDLGRGGTSQPDSGLVFV